jgi:hypothetical protein
MVALAFIAAPALQHCHGVAVFDSFRYDAATKCVRNLNQ